MRKSKPKTQIELLHRRYASALKTLSDFQTDAAFFHASDFPIRYEDLDEQIRQLRCDFQQNVFYVLPSARIV